MQISVMHFLQFHYKLQHSSSMSLPVIALFRLGVLQHHFSGLVFSSRIFPTWYSPTTFFWLGDLQQHSYSEVSPAAFYQHDVSSCIFMAWCSPAAFFHLGVLQRLFSSMMFPAWCLQQRFSCLVISSSGISHHGLLFPS